MKIRRLLFLITTFLCGYIFHYCQVVFFKDILFVSAPVGVTKSLNNQSAFLVIFVLSSLQNLDRRRVIRETWGGDLKTTVRLYFVINAYGIPPETNVSLTKEQTSYGDLLIFKDIEDSFYSLTSTVLNAFQWVHDGTLAKNSIAERTFEDFAYVLKCDDDTYVRVDNLEQELRGKYSDEKLYWGFFDGRSRVKKSGKYKEMGWNICDTYIPYALGGGYILGRGPVEFIAKNAQYLRKYQNEDTSVGAWLANFDGLKRRHDPRFDTEYLSRGCHQSYLVTHKHDVEGLRRIYKNLQKTGQPCSKEYRTRLSYRYDWNVIPSKCCSRNNPAIP